ncbi:hypothetical protein D9M71_154000 [compost metagenome]
MINSADSRMKSCGQKVAPKIWNLLSERSQSTAWRPPQFNHTVPKNSKNRKPAPLMRRLRNSPVKLRVWIRLSLVLAFDFGRAGSNVSTVRTGILSLMVFRSSASIRHEHYERRSVCITDSGIALKSGSDGHDRPACDNLKHLSHKGANAWAKQLRRVLINVSQITESLSLAFRCRRPSTAPATVKASASASVM